MQGHSQRFLDMRTLHFHARRWRNYTFLWVTMRNAMHFILGQCVALRIKNWQFDEVCILHIVLQQ